MTILLLAVILSAQAQVDSQTRVGVVTGLIRNPDGSPATGVRVAAMAAPAPNTPGGADSIVSIDRSDDSGRYRLENILPGRYLLIAGRVDVPTYYPGGMDRSAAASVSVTAGSTLNGLDFVVAAESTAPVLLPLFSAATFSAATLMPVLRVSGNVAVDGGALPGIGNRGTITAGLAGSVSPTVTVINGIANVSMNASTTVQSAPIQGDGSFVLPLHSGNWSISATMPQGYSVKSVMSGAVDLMAQPLQIAVNNAAAPPPIQITLSSTIPRMKITGRITDEETGMPTTDGTVHLRITPSVGTRKNLDGNGSFEFAGLLPGNYTLDISAFAYATITRELVVVDRDLNLGLTTRLLK